MCGIAGYIGPERIDEGRIRATLGVMKRRGPDHQDFERHVTPDGRHVALLHARLSIIDLHERANQPFRIGRHALIFNGELYNYLERREALTSPKKPPLTTNSDTEAFLRTLMEDGVAGLDACEGMWAFVWYDEDSGQLVLGRDRFGEKPLYLMRDGKGGLYFGSEVKFLAMLSGRRPAPDLTHLRRFLVNGYKSIYKGTAGFFEGVEELPAASVLTITANGMKGERFWKPDYNTRDNNISWDDAVDDVRTALIRSVELRLRADVPLAFCLSGGVDSNALIAIAKRVFGYDVHGFTIMNRDKRYDERDMVEIAVKEMELRHTGVDLSTEGFLPNMRELVRQHDAPVYTISYYVQWRLMEQIAKEGYRIAISGTGADELFSGYFDHHAFYLQAIQNDPALYAESLANWREYIGPVVRNPYLQDPEVFVKNPGERRHIYLDQEGFAAYLTDPFAEAFAEEAYTAEPLRNRMLNELFHEAVPPILHEDDLNAMYFSIENRSPYLDRTLFETAMRMPSKYLVRRGRAKALLRAAVKGIAPEAIIDNPSKVGFNAPILDLLDVRQNSVREEVLADGPIWDVIRKDKIEALIDKSDLPNSESKFLFYFLGAKLFLEEWAA